MKDKKYLIIVAVMAVVSLGSVIYFHTFPKGGRRICNPITRTSLLSSRRNKRRNSIQNLKTLRVS